MIAMICLRSDATSSSIMIKLRLGSIGGDIAAFEEDEGSSRCVAKADAIGSFIFRAAGVAVA